MLNLIYQNKLNKKDYLALYYYVYAAFYVEEPDKLYNDLKFIGTFTGPWKG